MAFIIDTINGSGLYAQSAASASVATYDSNGNEITATYLTAHQPISADEWNDVYDTVNVYSGSWTGSETSPTASVDSNGSIDIVSSNNTVYFDVNGTWFNDAVNSAVDVPTGVMVESACEYNAVNEISGYNGSAIAQYGAEKQWLQHDDTIVHVANSAQYAFGCNVSAIAQLLSVDETVLFSGEVNATTATANLSEPISSFNKVKMLCKLNRSTPVAAQWFEFTTDVEYYTMLGGLTNSNTTAGKAYMGEAMVSLSDGIIDYYNGKQLEWGSTAVSNSKNASIYKVVGIGRKS